MIDLATTQRQFLTPVEISEILNVARRTVYYWLQTGKLPYIQPKNGGAMRIPTAAVKTLVRQRVRHAHASPWGSSVIDSVQPVQSSS